MSRSSLASAIHSSRGTGAAVRKPWSRIDPAGLNGGLDLPLKVAGDIYAWPAEPDQRNRDAMKKVARLIEAKGANGHEKLQITES